MAHDKTSRGRRVFLVVWLGQVVSVVGSGLTSFALGLWVYERTGSVTPYALTGLFAVLPSVLLSTLAGVLVDRWDRRRVMLLSDTGAGLATLAVALLFLTGRVQVWHIYLATAVSAAFSTCQRLAYTATTAQLVSKERLGRANGLVQFGQAASEILAPTLAGILLLTVKVQGVLLIDFATFLFAVAVLGNRTSSRVVTAQRKVAKSITSTPCTLMVRSRMPASVGARISEAACPNCTRPLARPSLSFETSCAVVAV